MNRDPDYSAPYLVLQTSDATLAGHGFTFTIGRGNENRRAARRAAGRAVFRGPVRMQGAAYGLPRLPGYSTEMEPEALALHRYSDGRVWRAAA